MNKEIKYLADGREVEVIKKIEDGYLVRQMWQYDNQDEEEIEDPTNGIEFYPKLYDNPPTEKLAAVVITLNKEIFTLNEDIRKLRNLKQSEESVLNKISKIPGFQSIVNYLSGDFNFIMTHDDLTIKSRQDIYLEKDLLIEMNKKGEVILMIDGYHKIRVTTFNTKVEASEERKRIYMMRISNCSNIYQLEEHWKNYSYKDLMTQPDVISLHDTKLSEIRELEKKNQINNAMKEINEKLEFLKKKDINLKLVEENVK